MCRYNGVVYTSCTTVDQAAAWCATQVDAGGNFVTDQYGFCPRSVSAVELSTRTFAKFHSSRRRPLLLLVPTPC